MEGIDCIKKLIEKAMEAQLSLEELYSSWEDKWDDNEFFSEVFYDLEEGVQHVPGYLFKKGINIKEWKSSSMYGELKDDLKILNEFKDKTSDEMFEAKKLKQAMEELKLRRSRRRKSF